MKLEHFSVLINEFAYNRLTFYVMLTPHEGSTALQALIFGLETMLRNSCCKKSEIK